MDEKWEEKELEKREEKSPEEKDHGEKSYEEKYRRDPLGAIVWAAILIWCGLVFLANNLGFMDKIQPVFDFLPKAAESWEIDVPFITSGAIQIFLLGTAFIFSVEIAIRLTFPEYRRPVFGSVVLIGVLLSLAFDNWELFFPLLLIAFGISILFRRR